MTRKFADRDTERFWREGVSPGLPTTLLKAARRRLAEVLAAERLDHIGILPGSRLKKLKDSDPPRFSIRINDQYRVTFEWHDGAAWNVKVEDYR